MDPWGNRTFSGTVLRGDEWQQVVDLMEITASTPACEKERCRLNFVLHRGPVLMGLGQEEEALRDQCNATHSLIKAPR